MYANVASMVETVAAEFRDTLSERIRYVERRFDDNVARGEKEWNPSTDDDLVTAARHDDGMRVWHENRRDAARFEAKTENEVRTWRFSFFAGALLGAGLGVAFCVWVLSFTYPECENGPNGLLCNGQGYCGTSGDCVCTNPLFSGKACTVVSSWCDYKSDTGTMCGGGRGLCSFAMTFAQVPEPCIWIPKSYSNPYPIQRGWDSAGCVAYLQAKHAEIEAALGNPTALAQIEGVAGVPQCMCLGKWTGPTCTYTACPRNNNQDECSNHGNKTVGLFANGSYSESNTGCQCNTPFVLLQPSILNQLSDDAKILIQQRYLNELSQPICGQPYIVNDTVILSKGVINTVAGTVDGFSCHCNDTYFGSACQFGKCPTNGDGAVCSNHGHRAVGFGVQRNASICRGDCAVRCVDGYVGCKPPGIYDGVARRCVSAAHPELFDSSQLCATPEVCPEERPWRCMDGSCVSPATQQVGTSLTALCNLGYTAATLDWKYYDRARVSRRCVFGAGDDAPLSSAQTLAECVALLAPYLDLNGTNLVEDPEDPDVVRASLVTSHPNAQTVWMQLEVQNIDGTLGVTSSVTFAGTQTFFAPVEAASVATISYAPQVNLTKSYMQLNAYNDTFPGTELTIRLFGINVQVFPIPLWGVAAQLGARGYDATPIPDDWSVFRVKNVYDGSYVELVTQSYFVETYEGFSDGANVTVVFSPQQTSALSSALVNVAPTSVALLSTCLLDPLQCAFTYNATDGSMRSVVDSTKYACYAGLSVLSASRGWYVDAARCDVSAEIATTNSTWWAVRALRFVISATNLVPVTNAQRALASAAWTAQFKAVKPLSSAVQWSSTSALRVRSIEIMSVDDVTAPCTCPPQMLTQTPNRTELNARWANEISRRRARFVPDERVVAQFNQYGRYHYERGVVVGTSISTNSTSNNVTSIVRVQGYGLLTLPTPTLRVLSNLEYIEGNDDAPLSIYASRCPPGYAAPVVINGGGVNETCACTVDAAAYTASCACTTVNCTCSGVSAAAVGSATLPLCACDAFSASQFQDTLAAYLLESLTQCACALAPRNEPFEDFYASVRDEYVVTVDVDPQSDVVPVVQQFTFYGESTACADVVEVYGNYSQFAAQQSLGFAQSQCYDGVSQLVVNTTQVNVWTSYTFVLGGEWNGTIWVSLQPPGFAIRTGATYSASSNNDSAANAADFSLDWWSSRTDLPENPVWLEIAFEELTTVSRVYVDMRGAALPLVNSTTNETFAVIPVRVDVQGAWGEPQRWHDVSFFVSDVVPNYDVDSQNFTVQFNSSIPPVAAVRLLSPFALSVRTFTAYTDQVCDCVAPPANSQINNATQQIDKASAQLLPPIPFLDSYSVLQYVVERSQVLDVEDPNCVYRDACVVTIPGIDVVKDVSRDGKCQDIKSFNIENNVTYRETEVTVESVITPTQLYVSYFGSDPGDVTFDAFTYDSMDVYIAYSPANSTIIPDVAYVDSNYTTQNELMQTLLSRADANFNTIWYFIFPENNTEQYTGAAFAVGTAYLTTTTTTTSIIPSVVPAHPQAYCDAGLDAYDCGCSSRLVAVYPGLTCGLSNYQQQVYDDYVARNGSLPDSQRPLVDFLQAGGSFTLRLRPITRNYSDPVSGCSQSVCYSPYTRCADGSCRLACFPYVRYDNPGDGCVATNDDTKAFSCACARGYSGIECQMHTTKAANCYESFYTIDATPWRRAGGPPPLRQQPPFASTVARRAPITAVDVVQMNGTPLPINLRVRARSAPYGTVLAVQRRLSNGDVIYSDCPYAARGPFGQLLTLDDCAVRDPYTGQVVSWVQWPTADGANVTIVWGNVTAYDDFPLRVPANGECVSSPSDFALSTMLYTTCNGRGTDRPDDTCDCAPGYTTFAFTKAWSRRIAVPYASDPLTGETIPNTWFAPPNNNWRDFRAFMCMSRDCTSVDCSVPLGCFAGTPERAFADKLQWCSPATSGGIVSRNGMCGVTQDECAKNNVVPPKVCSGNGIAYLIDYKDPPEYACICGSPISITATIDDVVNPTELEPNGFGGRDCSEYYCTAPGAQRIIWSPRDPHTGSYYYDLGVQIPGLWIAFCGKANDPSSTIVPVGPDPNDVDSWSACCPGETRLDRCEYIPCKLNGEIMCATSQQCYTSGGSPLVYACNGHGRETHAGCDCDYDYTTGIGYAPDYARFDRPNCFLRVSCAVSVINGRPCHGTEACSRPDLWIRMPEDRFYEDQNEVALALAGYGVSNRTYFAVAAPVVQTFESMLVTAASQKAVQYQSALAGYYGCVCVYPDESPDSPCCMRAYDAGVGPNTVGPYGKTYASPWRFNDVTYSYYSLDPTDLTALLDSPNMRAIDPTYLLMSATLPLNASWPEARYVTLLRLYARPCTIAGTCATTKIDVLDATSSINVCPTLTVSSTSQWGYVDVFCAPSYTQLNYKVLSPVEYLTYCGSGVTMAADSDECLAWERATCVAIPGAVWIDAGSLTVLRDCAPEFAVGAVACCVPTQILDVQKIDALQIYVTGPLQVQNVRVFGYADVIEPINTWLKNVLITITGNELCPTRPDYTFVTSALGAQDKSFYVPGDSPPTNPASYNLVRQGVQTMLTYNESADACRDTGGYLAQINGVVETGQMRSSESLAMSRVVSDRGYAAALVALRNVYRKLTYDIDEFVELSCNYYYGCRFPTPRSPPAFPYAYYANPRTNTYTEKWDIDLLDGGWTGFFDRMGFLAPYTEDIDYLPSRLTVSDINMCREIAQYLYGRITGATMFSCLVTYGYSWNEQYLRDVVSAQRRAKASATDQWVSFRPYTCRVEVFESTECDYANFLGTRFQEYTFMWSLLARGTRGNEPTTSHNWLTNPGVANSVSAETFFSGMLFGVGKWNDGSQVNSYLGKFSGNGMTNVDRYSNVKSFRMRGASCVLNIQTARNGVNFSPRPNNAEYTDLVYLESSTPFSMNYATDAYGVSYATANTMAYGLSYSEQGAFGGTAIYRSLKSPRTGSSGTCWRLTPFSQSSSVIDSSVFKTTFLHSFQTSFYFPDLPVFEWASATVSLEAEAVTPTNVPNNQFFDADKSRAKTMEWLTNHYMCMGIEMFVQKIISRPVVDTAATSIAWYRNLRNNIVRYVVNSDMDVYSWMLDWFGAWRGTQTGFLGPTIVQGSALGGFCYPAKWDAYTIDPNFGPIPNYPSSNNRLTTCGIGWQPMIPVTQGVDFGLAVCSAHTYQIQQQVNFAGANSPVIPGSVYSYSAGASWRPIPDCRYCQKTTVASFQYDANVMPVSGDRFPTVQTVAVAVEDGSVPVATVTLYGGGRTTMRPIMLRFNNASQYAPSIFRGQGTDGLAYLHSMAASSRPETHWRYFAVQLAQLRTSDFDATWTIPDCVLISAMEGLNGYFVSYPCNTPRNYLCQFSYARYTALPGRTCDVCKTSVATGGFARAANTSNCFSEFAADLTEYNQQLYEAYQSGRLPLVVGASELDWDSARQWTLENGIYLIENVPGVRQLFNAGVSTQKGQLSKGAAVDTYLPINMKLPPYDCGVVVPKSTAVPVRVCAYTQEACNQDAVLEQGTLPASELAPGLLGITVTDALALALPRCGSLLRPADLVQWTPSGGASPDLYTYLQLVGIYDSGAITYVALSNVTHVYNTGKTTTAYVFQANSTNWITGTLTVECATCGYANLTVWVSALDPTMSYPSTRQVVGSTLVTPNVRNYPFQFAFVANDDYLTAGFDITSVSGATITFNPVVLANNESLAACRNTQALLPKHAPKKSLVSSAPFNPCMLRERDLRMYGAIYLGQCLCDAPYTGSACDAPAVVTAYGKFAGGGQGIDGLAVAPTGEIVPTVTDPITGEMGLYCWTTTFFGPRETHCGVKTMQLGVLFRSILLELSSDFGRVTRLDSLYGANPFAAVPFASMESEYVDFDAAESYANALGMVVASFVNYDELVQVLALVTYYPIFVSLSQNIPTPGQGSLTGIMDYSWFWTDRGVQFGSSCLDEGCGVLLPSEVTCTNAGSPEAGYWSTQLCDAINVGNSAYKNTTHADSDGSYTTTYCGASSTFHVPAAIITVQAWAYPNGGSMTVSSAQCTSDSTTTIGSGPTILYYFTCDASSGATTITFTYTNACVREIQAFVSEYTTRMPFYPLV